MRRIFALQCDICKAVSHPTRLEIVDLLSCKEVPASALLASLNTSKANLSKHMNQLVRVGIVEQRRQGRHVYYRLIDPEIHQACSIMRSILYRRLKRGEVLASAIRSPKNR